MMKQFITHEGIGAALRRENVDTDIIIPLIHTVTKPRRELGNYAFEQIRFHQNGEPRDDFVLNLPQFKAASVLFAGKNFGCGSSREWAVDAIDCLDIRVVIAPSFGDIFFNNCIKNGILPIELNKHTVEHLMDQCDAVAGEKSFFVDLEAQTITAPDKSVIEFAIDPAFKKTLLLGKDEIDLTLEINEEIRSFQKKVFQAYPWIQFQ